jgi:hypothetical protein
MNRVFAFISISVFPLLLLGGCAGGASLQELRGDVKSATIVQHGKEPLRYTLGVVDTSSFWAAYGGGVSSQLGGGAVWQGLESSGKAEEMKRAPTVAEVMRNLYNNHPLVSQVSSALIPKYAAVWGQTYDPSRLRVVSSDTPVRDQNLNFVAFNPVTDLVLVFEVSELTLTERQTMGRALAAGFTLGTNTKSVSAQVTVWLEAYKRDAASGKYKRVWLSSCGADANSMPIDFPFPEVIKSRDKAKQLWDAATPLAIEKCGKYFDMLVEQQRKVAQGS